MPSRLRHFSREGNDVADFARTMTDACTAPACRLISLHDLKRGARLMLAAPLLYFAVYGFAGSYVGAAGVQHLASAVLSRGPNLGATSDRRGRDGNVRGAVCSRAAPF